MPPSGFRGYQGQNGSLRGSHPGEPGVPEEPYAPQASRVYQGDVCQGRAEGPEEATEPGGGVGGRGNSVNWWRLLVWS